MQKEIARNAYESMSHLFQANCDYSVKTSTNIVDDKNGHISKSIKALDGSVRFWSNYYNFDSPIEFVCVDENGKDFLFNELKRLNFLDAMPKGDRWGSHTKDTLFGSGGYSMIDDKIALLYWQVSGTKNDFSRTGEIKTPPHLFTHAVQSIVMSQAGYSVTDLPGWFVEGQSDFIGLMSISKNFEEYWNHRSLFFATAYVPGGDDVRRKLKKYSKEDWKMSLYNSPEKFAGIPLVDEYYSGLLAYEALFYLSKGHEFEMNKKLLNGESFYKLVSQYSGLNKESFCEYSSKLLLELGATINVR
jgi:hypothetical protein